MHKKHSSTHLKVILSDVLLIAFEHIRTLANELKKINLSDPDLEEKLKDRAQILSHVMTLLNDVIHPAHDTALSLLPGGKEFIDICINNQRIAIEKKLISGTCNCYACGVNKVKEVK